MDTVEGTQTDRENCWKQIKGHWSVLGVQLVPDRRVELLCSFLLRLVRDINCLPYHFGKVATSVCERKEVEEKFSDICRPLLDEFLVVILQEMAVNIPEMTTFEMEVLEVDQPNNYLSLYFRRASMPFLENKLFDLVRSSFLVNVSNTRSYPLLKVFFLHESLLERYASFMNLK